MGGGVGLILIQTQLLSKLELKHLIFSWLSTLKEHIISIKCHAQMKTFLPEQASENIFGLSTLNSGLKIIQIPSVTGLYKSEEDYVKTAMVFSISIEEYL